MTNQHCVDRKALLIINDATGTRYSTRYFQSLGSQNNAALYATETSMTANYNNNNLYMNAQQQQQQYNVGSFT